MLLADRITLADKRITSDGYLVANARTARTGIQLYLGAEVERPDLPVARVYRPEDEVFKNDSLSSYAYKPVTDDHPSDMVDASNWRQVAVGNVGSEIVRDGEFVRVPLMLADAQAIAAIDNGKRELSAGYHCTIDWAPGTTPSGEAFDGVQRNIKINHVALVDAGRAGSDCRIGDIASTLSRTEIQTVNTTPTQTVLIDGVSAEVSPLVAQLVTKLQKQLDSLEATMKAREEAVKAAEAATQTAIATKDGEIAALKAQSEADLAQKDGEITALKAQVLDTAGIERKAEERRILVQQVKAIDSAVDVTGKSDADLRRAAVNKALGDAAKDMSDDHVLGAFKAVAARLSPGVDAIRDAFMAPAGANFGHGPTVLTMADKEAAHNEMVERMRTAHLPKSH